LTQIGSFFGGLLACVWIIWLSFAHSSFVRTALASKIPAFLGKISYSLYLVHPLALQFVRVYLVKQDASWSLPSMLLTLSVSVAASLAAAYVFYRVIELPSVRWTHRVRHSPLANATAV
jgi:peptidoglycan/LPS O-acetylase OafA/YrhL